MRQINMKIIIIPHAFNIGGKHTGIGGANIRGDNREAQSGNRIHRKAFDCRNLGMATTKKNQIGQNWRFAFHQQFTFDPMGHACCLPLLIAILAKFPFEKGSCIAISLGN